MRRQRGQRSIEPGHEPARLLMTQEKLIALDFARVANAGSSVAHVDER
jgi:hypothetical protein